MTIENQLDLLPRACVNEHDSTPFDIYSHTHFSSICYTADIMSLCFLSGETSGAERSVGPDASAGTASEIGSGGQTDGQRGSSWLVRAAIAPLGNTDVLTMGQALATSACSRGA